MRSGVHDTAVGEDDGQLAGEKWRVGIGLRHGRAFAAQRRQNLRRVFGRDLDEERVGRVGLHQRPFATKPQAAHRPDFDLVLQPGVSDGLFKLFLDALGARGHAPGGHAAAEDDLFPGRQFLLFDVEQIAEDHGWG